VLDPGDLQQTQQQQQQGNQPMLSDEVGVAAALTASFLATDEALTTDDGCTATAVLLEACGDEGLLLRVANVGDSLALLVNLTR
jgi:serine/threonine protein phosphatase PrpC